MTIFQTFIKYGKNLKQEQLNDKYKYDYAIQNGIKNYIVIDARKSDFEFIRNSIINELCAITGRTDFEFYQAVREPSSHEIRIEKEIY